MKKLTNDTLSVAADKAEDMADDLRQIAESIRKSLGWEDDVTSPAAITSKFAALARAAADLSSAMITRISFEEGRKELEQTLRSRLEDEAP